jgi:aminodeoxyfutalosine synthase
LINPKNKNYLFLNNTIKQISFFSNKEYIQKKRDYLMLDQLVNDSKALDKAIAGEELSFDDGMELMNYDNLHMLGAVADQSRKKLVGDEVSFTASYYMNYTNVCAASCQMCAFYRKDGDEDAYTLTPAQIEQRVGIAKQMGATEVHIVGGFHPKLPLDYYEDMMKLIKKNHPELKIKALTAAEIFFLSKLTKNSVKEVLSRLKASGLDSLPGGGAELFHPDIRPKIARGKCTGQEWLDTVETAHNMGIRSNVTMLYGHIEKPEHVVDHLLKIRELQKKTKGFITLIPLKFSLDNTGGSDLVGTAFSEEVYRAAGKPTASSINELEIMVKEIGRQPIQRDTFFNVVNKF